MKNKTESQALINVLCLEDVLKDAELLQEMLLDADYQVTMDIAKCEREFVELLTSQNYDIIFSDNSLPGMNAFKALKLALELKPEIPFICISGTIGEEKAVELLKLGASDYVLKGNLGRLALVVKRALNETEMLKESKKAAEELKKKMEELIHTNKQLAFQIRENGKREDELVILNTVLVHQNKEKIKQTEELIKAKEHAEKSDKLKTQFLTNMSHEIRTPMNGILGFTELLKEPNLTVEDQQDFIKNIGVSSTRMLNTINNIVDISTIESGLIIVNIKESNINSQIDYVYKFFKQEIENNGMQFFFKKSLPSNEAKIKTDIKIINAILMNLVKNAIKFSSEGYIEIGYEKKGKYLEFYVQDTGTGIPINQQKMIFERFRQSSESADRLYDGSGLGLSISKSYVEMLGGKLWVESEEKNGSIFYFTIPYNNVSEEKSAINKADSGIEDEVEMKKLKILVAEDDKISFFLMERILNKISSEILHADTGDQAVKVCLDNPDLDLVLMDIRMPVMDGIEATQQIRRFNKDVIIIAQTAFGFSDDSEKAIKAGCNDYISKPINKALLLELIRSIVIMNRK